MWLTVIDDNTWWATHRPIDTQRDLTLYDDSVNVDELIVIWFKSCCFADCFKTALLNTYVSLEVDTVAELSSAPTPKINTQTFNWDWEILNSTRSCRFMNIIITLWMSGWVIWLFVDSRSSCPIPTWTYLSYFQWNDNGHGSDRPRRSWSSIATSVWIWRDLM